MQTIRIPFSSPLNESLQKGDIVYYSSPEISGGFTVVNQGSIIKFGIVVDFDHLQHTVDVIHDEQLLSIPPAESYIMFEKDKRVNSSSLIGYYAEVEFKNNRKDKIELFAVGSEVSENSK